MEGRACATLTTSSPPNMMRLVKASRSASGKETFNSIKGLRKGRGLVTLGSAREMRGTMVVPACPPMTGMVT